MLNKMRNPIGFRFFVAGTGLDPYADGHRSDMLHLFRDDGQSVRQDLPVNISQFLFHVPFCPSVFAATLDFSATSIFTHSLITWRRAYYSLYINSLRLLVYLVLDRLDRSTCELHLE